MKVPAGAMEALAVVAPAIHDDIVAGKPAAKIVADMEPQVVVLLDFVAGKLLPFPFGTAVSIILLAIEHRQPWTDEETAAWMLRTQGGDKGDSA